MPIPDFQSLMLPMLEYLHDGSKRTNSEIADYLCAHFQISGEERLEKLPSGRQTKMVNRMAWAKAHMTRARLLQSPGRGITQITERGIEVLSGNPSRVDLRLLQQFPEYAAWRNTSAEKPIDHEEEAHPATPEESLGSAFQCLQEALLASLLDRIRLSSPSRFEEIVVDLLVGMGYGGSRADAAQVLGKSRDEGIDGLINEDRLGLDVIYVQAKQWGNAVGRPEIQKFAGALSGQHARKGIFVTSSEFTKEARDFAAKIENKIILVDGRRMAELMIEHGIGVSTISTFAVKRVDSDYFEEE